MWKNVTGLCQKNGQIQHVKFNISSFKLSWGSLFFFFFITIIVEVYLFRGCRSKFFEGKNVKKIMWLDCVKRTDKFNMLNLTSHLSNWVEGLFFFFFIIIIVQGSERETVPLIFWCQNRNLSLFWNQSYISPNILTSSLSLYQDAS